MVVLYESGTYVSQVSNSRGWLARHGGGGSGQVGDVAQRT